MSWLGVNFNESLKNIGGQISNLTREVLAEDVQDGGQFIYRGGSGQGCPGWRSVHLPGWCWQRMSRMEVSSFTREVLAEDIQDIGRFIYEGGAGRGCSGWRSVHLPGMSRMEVSSFTREAQPEDVQDDQCLHFANFQGVLTCKGPRGGGNGQSIGSPISDAIIRNWLWLTAIGVENWDISVSFMSYTNFIFIYKIHFSLK